MRSEFSSRRFLSALERMVPFVRGTAAAVILTAFWLPVPAQSGTDPLMQMACLGAVLLSGLIALTLRESFPVPSRLSSALLPAAALWAFAVPGLLNWGLQSLGAVPVGMLVHPVVAVGLLSMVAVLCLLPGLTMIFLTWDSGSSLRERRLTVAGIGCGLLLGVLTLSMSADLHIWRWLGVSLATGLCCLSVWRGGRVQNTAAEPTPSLPRIPASSHPAGRPAVWLLGALCGGGVTVALFQISQFVGRTAGSDLAALSGLMLGAACAGVKTGPSEESRNQRLVTLGLATGAWIALLAAGSSFWSEFCLRVTAGVSTAFWITLWRSCLAAGLLVPGGWIFGSLLSLTGEKPTARTQLPLCTAAVLAVCGIWLTEFRPAVLGTGLVVASLGIAGWCWNRVKFRQSPGWTGRVTRSALAGTALAGIFLSGEMNSPEAEKILFSTRTYQALREGIPSSRIAAIDDGRRVVLFEDSTSRWSAWKYRGSQWLVRHNGLTTELRASNPGRCPDSGADMVPAVLPLVLHRRPEQVLVVGLHMPTLQACQNWPLHAVTTLEGESGGRRLLAWMKEHGNLNLDGGPKFHFHGLPGSLGLLARHPQKYDVIILPQAQPGQSVTALQATREFYHRAAGQLRENGMLCQRIPYYDLGPETIRTIAATAEAAFPQVMLVESIPGELLLLASRSTEPLVDVGCIERLKTPQCRDLLARCGWDWGTILSRGGVFPERMKEFLGEHATVSDAGRGGLALRLPAEVARWDSKAQQTRMALSRSGQTLASILGDGPEFQELNARLDDLKLAGEIQTENPDQPWAYRAAIKQRLTDRQRSEIVQVKHEGLKRVALQEDQRRKDYLEALGAMARETELTPAQLNQLSRFTSPFDPLVSLFVHFELAELCARCTEPDPARELQHRLHGIYFTSAEDHSVRSVSTCLQLLCEHPEIAPTDTDRWDELNGLLEMCELRWSLRLADSRSSRYETIDTEKSVEAVEAALKEMDRLAAANPALADGWPQRRESIETSLLRPLRGYRSRQISRVPVPVPVR